MGSRLLPHTGSLYDLLKVMNLVLLIHLVPLSSATENVHLSTDLSRHRFRVSEAKLRTKVRMGESKSLSCTYVVSENPNYIGRTMGRSRY